MFHLCWRSGYVCRMIWSDGVGLFVDLGLQLPMHAKRSSREGCVAFFAAIQNLSSFCFALRSHAADAPGKRYLRELVRVHAFVIKSKLSYEQG